MNKLSLDKNIELSPKHLLKKMLKLEKTHNDMVEAEEASRKKRSLILSEMVGIKKILEDFGFNVESEIEKIRSEKV